jgi:hypothetical protein
MNSSGVKTAACDLHGTLAPRGVKKMDSSVVQSKPPMLLGIRSLRTPVVSFGNTVSRRVRMRTRMRVLRMRVSELYSSLRKEPRKSYADSSLFRIFKVGPCTFRIRAA